MIEDSFLRAYVYNRLEEGNIYLSKMKYENAKNCFESALKISRQFDEVGYIKLAQDGINVCNQNLASSLPPTLKK